MYFGNWNRFELKRIDNIYDKTKCKSRTYFRSLFEECRRQLKRYKSSLLYLSEATNLWFRRISYYKVLAQVPLGCTVFSLKNYIKRVTNTGLISLNTLKKIPWHKWGVIHDACGPWYALYFSLFTVNSIHSIRKISDASFKA